MTNFKPIEIQDKPLFDEFLRKDPPQVSELTFTNLFVWRHHYQPAWVEVDGCILIVFHPPSQEATVSGPWRNAGVFRPVRRSFSEVGSLGEGGLELRRVSPHRRCHGLLPVGLHPQKGTVYGLPPFGPGDKRSALEVLCREIEKQTPEVRISRVGEDFVTHHVDPAKYDTIPDRENSDYIYLAKDLIHLSGNKYHRKKNHLNQFIKNHAFEYRPLDAELVKRVLGMQEAWCRIRECVEKPDLLAEDHAVHEALTYFEELGYQGGAILIDSVVEAFSLGEPLNQDTAVIHIEKANPDILGLYAAVNQLFCINAW